MPWEVKTGITGCSGYAVVKKGTTTMVPGGCHMTKKEADAHRAALYANEPQAGAQAVTMPALITIPDVDLLATGDWPLASGPATFTTADLQAAVDAAACPGVGSPIIKLGHTDGRFTPVKGDGEPAIGRVDNMTLRPGGAKLAGDLAGMPGWLAAVSESAYPRRSIEGMWNFQCQIGHTHEFVVSAVALLGVAPPGVGVLNDLDDLAALYGVAAGGVMAEAQAGAVTVDDVRRAYYTSGQPMSRWITAIQLDPPQLIVQDDADDKTYRIPYAVKGGTVTFKDPVQVEVEYADVAAAAEAMQLAGIAVAGGLVLWGSAEDSRDVAAWDAGAQVRNMGDNPSASAIKKMFALPGDSKSSSSLPHHTCPPGGSVGGPDLGGCQAGIGAINGARGGLKGKSAAELKRAYGHLAGHVRALGSEPAEYKGPSAAAPGDAEAAGNHGMHTGTHSHNHSAFGGQGGDATHEHDHTHAGDNRHDHAHAAGPVPKEATDVDLNDEQKAAIRAALGLGDDEDITAEHITAMAAKLAAPPPEPPEPVKEPVAASAGDPPLKLPKGVMLIDEDAWKAMGRRAEAGERAEQRMRRNDRDQVVAAAVKQGKFSVDQVDKYNALWDSNPEGTRSVIAAMPKGIVPTEDRGIPGGEEDDLDAEYISLFGADGKGGRA